MQKKRKFTFAKLVRDKIPGNMESKGDIANCRILETQEYIQELLKKLIEETSELKDSGTNRQELLKEIADIQEIIDNLVPALGFEKKDLQKEQEKKNEKAGSFKERIYIEDVEVSTDSEWIKYYLENSDRYPEIIN